MEFTDTVIREAREEFQALIPEIPFIGGDENRLTRELSKTAEEWGKIVFDSLTKRSDMQYILNQPAREPITELYR